MSAEQAQREPTMEEILASIRRIISEEDKPAEAGGDVLDLEPGPAPIAEMKAPSPQPAAPPPQAAAPTPAPKPEAMPKAEMAPVYGEPEEFIPPARSLEEDLIVEDVPDPIPELAPAPAPVAAAPAPAPREWTPPVERVAPTETLTSAPVAHQAAGTLGRLMGSMLVSSSGTLDDVVRELLKPMLKEWLDANLPQLVEAEVAKEIDRIRRLAR
jgi:cell pole-organizing protein PopZ